MKPRLLFLIGIPLLIFVSIVRGQTNVPMSDIGSTAPAFGPYDIVQTFCTYCGSAHGAYDGPDGMNYYTDNGANHGQWAGQTFTTGPHSAGYKLTSVSIKTAGVDDGWGSGSLQTFHLYLYSVSGSTATLMAEFTNDASFADGNWVQWNLAPNPVTLAANSTYAYGFGRDSSGSGYAGLGNASGNPYPGGELAMLPTSGGTITFGDSHSYDATFEIGLNAVGAPTVAVSANPPYGLPGGSFSITATVTPGLGAVTNVAADLSALGGPSVVPLDLSSPEVYTNSFTVPAGAPAGSATVAVSATATSGLTGAGSALFNVLTRQTATIDSTRTFQTIEGLGGALAFYNGWLTAHPYKMEIYTNAFAGLNLSMLRFGDWYRYGAGFNSTGDGSVDGDIVSNADRILGHPIPVYMSSWSPPAFLKSNGQTGNGGTLIHTNGGFDYAGFAQYWYDSVNAYRSNGVSPTWISIQNEPDFVAGYDSCIFHPTEDTVNGTNYASYSKALDAVHQKLSTLPSPPKLLAPEVVHIAYNDLANYAATLHASSFYGINYHLYGGNNSDLSGSTNIFPNKPHFMTEYGVGGLIGAATLIHNCLTLGQDSGVNYWSLVWPGTGGGLIQMENPWSSPSTWTNAPPGIPEPHGYWLTPAYWAMKHFSYYINPGFKRVNATVSDRKVLISAYLSPDHLRLVVVMINTSAGAPSIISVNYGAFAADRSSVFQTAGTNTWQSLGPLARPLTLPPSSVTTLVLDKTVTVDAASAPSPASGASGVSLSSSLKWSPGSNAVTHAVFWGTSSNAVATATTGSPQFRGIVWTNSFPLKSAAWGRTYYWRVDEIAYSNTNHGPVWSFSTAPAVQLPVPWLSQDIGVATIQSSAIYTNGLFTVTGAGADIQGTADTFRYAYFPISGNGTIIARVTGLQNVNAWSKAGVMIRAGLNANAANTFMAVTPGNGVTWQYRSSAGASTTWNNTTGPSVPYWVKLVRSGNTFTGNSSADGIHWNQQGTATFVMAPSALVGLAVTSHNSGTVGMATFDNVTAPAWPPLPGVPGGLAATAGNAQVALNWTASTAATSYNVKRSTTPEGPYSLVSNVLATNYDDTGLTNGTTYYYVVSGLNVAGQSPNSGQASATPQGPLTLGFSLSGTNFLFSWPAASTGFTLQSTTNLASGHWMPVTAAAPRIVSNRWQVLLPPPGGAGATFYRLAQ